MTAKEQKENVTDIDRTAFIVSLRELVEKNVIDPERAFRLIEQLERGRISLSQAMGLIEALLAENPGSDTSLEKESHTRSEPDVKHEAHASANRPAEETHKVVADRVESVSMGLGITSGVVAAGAGLAAPGWLSAAAIGLGISSTPLIITVAPIVATVATAAGVLSGGTYFYSKWKTSRSKKASDIET
ncbi:MAG: hypothetical protein JWR40_107 [Massilia sp.]|nr:hypothetical protein [Massilia sp.]